MFWHQHSLFWSIYNFFQFRHFVKNHVPPILAILDENICFWLLYWIINIYIILTSSLDMKEKIRTRKKTRCRNAYKLFCMVFIVCMFFWNSNLIYVMCMYVVWTLVLWGCLGKSNATDCLDMRKVGQLEANSCFWWNSNRSGYCTGHLFKRNITMTGWLRPLSYNFVAATIEIVN